MCHEGAFVTRAEPPSGGISQAAQNWIDLAAVEHAYWRPATIPFCSPFRSTALVREIDI